MASLNRMALWLLPLMMVCLGCESDGEPGDEPTTEIKASRDAEETQLAATNSQTEKNQTPANPNTQSPNSNTATVNREDVAATTAPAGEPNVETLQDSVIDALDAGDLDSAWSAIRSAARLDRNNFDTQYLMARVLAERNRFSEAVKILDALAIKDPSIELTVLGQTAEWSIIDGRWQQGEDRFRRLADQMPQVGIAHRKLAELLIRKGQRQEACAYFLQLCGIGNVEEVELRHLLQRGQSFSGMESADERSPVGTLGKARLQHGENQLEVALSTLQETSAETFEAFALRGKLLALTHRQSELNQWESTVIEESEAYADFWFAKGVQSQNSNNHESAIEFFCRSALLNPTDSQTYQYLSESLGKIGDNQTAITAKQRSEWIAETHRIGQAFTSQDTRDPQLVASLCQLLDNLNRPLESLAWQAVGMVYNQQSLGISNAQLTQQLQRINQQRIESIQNSDPESETNFILCGIKLQNK